MAALDLDPLKNAVNRLREAMELFEREPSDYLRDSVIKRFEFTYELSVRLLKRALEIASLNSDEIDQMSFPQLIRTADEQGFVLSGWPRWSEFRKARNRSAHAYNEQLALDVLAEVPAFEREAEFLYHKLMERRRHLDV